MPHTVQRRKPLPCYDDLMGSWNTAWQMLVRGVADRKHGFHACQVATLTSHGAPTIRTVILRGCDPAEHTVRFHTDTRSGKIAEIASNPRGCVHFYGAREKVQLRLDVRFTVLEGALRDQAWSETRPFSRVCYQVTAAPGSPVHRPSDVVFDAEATQDGARYFRPVVAQVFAMEWLYLASTGHRRARFTVSDGAVSGCWLVP